MDTLLQFNRQDHKDRKQEIKFTEFLSVPKSVVLADKHRW